jgi:hypothetical protein
MSAAQGERIPGGNATFGDAGVNGGEKSVHMAAQKSTSSAQRFLSENGFFVRPGRTASSSRPAVSKAGARSGGQGGPKGIA